MRKDIKVETILLSPVSRVILSGLSFKKQSTIKLDFIYRETITGNARDLLHFLYMFLKCNLLFRLLCHI